jgi:hypothetical protein
VTSRLIPFLILFACVSQQAFAHGGVVEEEDLCVIKINYLKGHFKIYQPRIDGHKEYCEDLPNATESVFVMEYMHEGLGQVPVDFRIIRDVTGKGRFARWEDVAAIGDLDAVTEFYKAPVVEPDVFTVIHEFDTEGDYIGIVTADVADTDRIYRAVFPFEVGYTGLGYWPLIFAMIIVLQAGYFFMSGRYRRWREARRKSPLTVVPVLLLVAVLPDVATAAWSVDYESSLKPIPINRMHSWEIVVRDDDGKPVTGAEISVEGGMPVHDHGLPTRPRVTEELGDGRYLLEGLRFHMAGEWEIVLTIKADGKTRIVVIPLRL